MDLKQQLVIWKRAGFLQGNLSLSPKFSNQLVDLDIFTVSMMAKIQREKYHSERILRMLSLLGKHGSDIWDKFLTALNNAGFKHVARDLIRTEKLTKFGEMLPPSFTYFMDLSEFLKLYPHIAIKLGEEGKHLVQTFIEGKIQMEHSKQQDIISMLEGDNKHYDEIIEQLMLEKEECKLKEEEAEQRKLEAEGRVNGLLNKITELENTNKHLRNEIRQLRYLSKQQNDLENYLREEMTNYYKETKTETKRYSSASLHMKFLESQVNLEVVRLHLVKTSLKHIENEEKRLQLILESLNQEKTTKSASSLKSNLMSYLSELREVKGELQHQEKEREEQLTRKEEKFTEKGQECEKIKFENHQDLVNDLKELIKIIQLQHKQEIQQIKDSQSRELSEWTDRMKKMKKGHTEDVERLKSKIKTKMLEIHKREILHKKLRSQITVLERYHAKNMNATQSIDQCRKIVRGIISDARKLKDIADEKDQFNPSYKDKENEENTKQRVKHTEEHEDDQESRKRKRMKRKKKVSDSLKDERLMYVGEKLCMSWRTLGRLLGLSNNRMELIEMDKPGPPDVTAFHMLKIWRDEEDGKAEQLIAVLHEMNRSELAVIVAPLKYPSDETESAVEHSTPSPYPASVTSSVPHLPPITGV